MKVLGNGRFVLFLLIYSGFWVMFWQQYLSLAIYWRDFVSGGLIDEALARSIDCRVVAGAANNPLTSPAVARVLSQRGILYVPDFLANCGGLIHVALEWYGRGTARMS